MSAAEIADAEPLLLLEVGAAAHGGHCVARHEGRVVFVRHALPGEQVLARLTEAGPADRFWRADAVHVVRASADRVPPRCALAVPGGCGGCDWQHASLAGQRQIKSGIVREQFLRLAKIDLSADDVVVEAVAGDVDGLAWRTRMRFAVDDTGRPGLRRHRSHDVVAVPQCPIAHQGVNATGVGAVHWPGCTGVSVVTGGSTVGEQSLVIVEPSPGNTKRVTLPRLAPEVAVAVSGSKSGEQPGERSGEKPGEPELTRVRGRSWVEEHVIIDGVQRRFRVTGAGFWQVHPGAAQTLLDAVLAAAMPRPGERAIDLYSGVGLFTAGLAARVGDSGAVLAVENDVRAAADARRSLHDLQMVQLEQGRVEAVLPRVKAADPRWAGADVVVLDPPRAGAGRQMMETILRLRPRVVAYVACDPASLARDVATAATLGYRMSGLRAFDLFPMTQHVECLATLVPA